METDCTKLLNAVYVKSDFKELRNPCNTILRVLSLMYILQTTLHFFKAGVEFMGGRDFPHSSKPAL
jgi:hypothetical protein